MFKFRGMTFRERLAEALKHLRTPKGIAKLIVSIIGGAASAVFGWMIL